MHGVQGQGPAGRLDVRRQGPLPAQSQAQCARVAERVPAPDAHRSHGVRVRIALAQHLPRGAAAGVVEFHQDDDAGAPFRECARRPCRGVRSAAGVHVLARHGDPPVIRAALRLRSGRQLKRDQGRDGHQPPRQERDQEDGPGAPSRPGHAAQAQQRRNPEPREDDREERSGGSREHEVQERGRRDRRRCAEQHQIPRAETSGPGPVV